MGSEKKLWVAVVCLIIFVSVLYGSRIPSIQPFQDRTQSLLVPDVVVADPPMDPQDDWWIPFAKP